MYNEDSLDTLCAALTYAMGIEPPEHAAEPNRVLTGYIDSILQGKKAERVFIYNPDAVAQWIIEKHPAFIQEVAECTELRLPLRSPMPSVTPVCFATMYTGAQPQVHGIQKYERPVIKTDSLFDAALRAGKRVAFVARNKGSMAMIYQQRNMDYYLFDTIEQVNAKAAQLIIEDNYDLIITYNGNYDAKVHSHGPESKEALAELRTNARIYGMFDALIENCWKKHTSLVGFCMDHGAHEIDDGLGSHGLEMPEDLNIIHFFKARMG